MFCEVFVCIGYKSQYYSSLFAKAVIPDLRFPFRHKAPWFLQRSPFLEEHRNVDHFDSENLQVSLIVGVHIHLWITYTIFTDNTFT